GGRDVIARIAAIGLVLTAWRVSAQTRPSPSTLDVIGPAGQHRVLTASDLASMRSIDTTVSSHKVHGPYRRVSLADLLCLVGRPRGDSRRGAALAREALVGGSADYAGRLGAR